MIYDKVVTNGSSFKVPGHLSLGQHFLERILENCDREGDAVGLVDGNTGEQMKYSKILQDTVNFAVGLKRWGVRRGDVVACYAESRNELFPVAIGAICCGATITMYNILYSKDELKHVLRISKPRVIFCSMSVLEAQFDTLVGTECIETIVQINGDLVKEVISLTEVVGYADPRSYEPETVSGGEDTAVILYSSGTTGLPKGVMLTHVNILYAMAGFNFGYTRDNCHNFLSILPWYHVFGLITTLHYLMCHKKLVHFTGFKAETYLNAIQKHQIHCLFTVPPVVVFLAKSALVDNYDMSSVKCMWSGAAPLSQETAEIATKRMPNFEKLIQGYGLTETTLAVLKDLDEASAEPGFLPVPGCKIKVVDLVTGENLGPNRQGEICVKAPCVMKGYVDNEAATRASFDKEGYLKTGDIGYYDEAGKFSVIDRLKEIIKYKGHQVAPAVIESVILQHSSVADCGVVGKPDEVAYELPTAFVVVKPGQRLTEEELLEFTATKLSPLTRLRGGVIFVDQIPKNSSGKILRRLLKQTLLGRK